LICAYAVGQLSGRRQWVTVHIIA